MQFNKYLWYDLTLKAYADKRKKYCVFLRDYCVKRFIRTFLWRNAPDKITWFRNNVASLDEDDGSIDFLEREINVTGTRFYFDVWLQDLPFIDNRHLWSITRLQQIPCVYLLQYQVNCTWYPLQTLYTCVHSNEGGPDWTTFLVYYTVFEGSWFNGSFSVGTMDNYLFYVSGKRWQPALLLEERILMY